MSASTLVNRSAARLQLLLAEEHVESNPHWVKHDVTGDGKPETFCNAFTQRIATKMGVFLPAGMLANDLATWLPGEGAAAGWKPCSGIEAQQAADRGELAVVSYRNPGGHGHIAPLAPSLGEPGIWLCNVGASNFTRGPLSIALGRLPVSFFTHT